MLEWLGVGDGCVREEGLGTRMPIGVKLGAKSGWGKL